MDYDEENCTDDENDKPCSRIVLNLTNKPSAHILYSKDKLLMKNANYIHFLSKDCVIIDPISKELAAKKRVNPKDLRELEPDVGNVVFTKTELGTIIFTLFIKEKHNNLARLEDVTLAIFNLKLTMEQLNVDTASISQIDNNLNKLPWALIEISLINHFSQKNFQITQKSYYPMKKPNPYTPIN